ncbi:hypothetical protein ACVWWG_001698 [Bradyrhizobium sp. LB7.2]
MQLRRLAQKACDHRQQAEVVLELRMRPVVCDAVDAQRTHNFLVDLYGNADEGNTRITGGV